MSYIQQGGAGGGAGTVTNTGGALTANAVVLGAGGNDEKVTTSFTTNGTTTLTVGVAAAGNGVVALAGNTSGTATLTAPAVAGTTTNPVVSSNNIQVPAGSSASPSVATSAGVGVNFTASQVNLVTGSTAFFSGQAAATAMGSGGALGFSSGAAADASSKDTAISRLAAGVLAVGTGAAASTAGLLLSGNTVFVTANFTTSGAGTALEAITGLTITVPAVAANWKFHAHLAYSQAVAAAAVAFGIQAVTNAPTNIFATGSQQITAGPPATIVNAVLATLTTTTATAIVTGTPGATATNYIVDLYGTCELAASANTIRLLVSTATAADLVTVLRGSYFSFCP